MNSFDTNAIAEIYPDISPALLPILTKIGDEINASLNLDEVLAHAAARIPIFSSEGAAPLSTSLLRKWIRISGISIFTGQTS